MSAVFGLLVKLHLFCSLSLDRMKWYLALRDTENCACLEAVCFVLTQGTLKPQQVSSACPLPQVPLPLRGHLPL